jgi:PKHD-type hydroxylase
MILKYNYWYFKKAVPIKTCEKILKAGRKKIKGKAGVGPGGKINPLVRDCKTAWIDEKWIYNIINPFIHTANKNAGWNFQWDWNERLQFTIYKKDEHYSWHSDQNSNLYKEKNKHFNGKIRKLSLTLQLTDKKKYEGGDFQFKWIKDKKDLVEVVTVDDAKDIGTIIIFPSFIYHQVLPVTKGKRESLVNWSIGKPFV